MSFTRTTKLTFLVLLAPLALLSACPDPVAQFDGFTERDCAIKGGVFVEGEGDELASCTLDGEGGSGGAVACPLPLETEADGIYMFALSSNLDRPKPFALDATVVTHIDGDVLTVDLTLQPLSKLDRTTPVGEAIDFPALAVNADGTFTWDLGEITLSGEANPLSANEVISTLQLQGSLCGGEENLGFICGDVTGIVAAPIPDHDLAGSTFAMLRYDMGGEKPAPVINCDKEPSAF